jgi:hypothetical protein
MDSQIFKWRVANNLHSGVGDVAVVDAGGAARKNLWESPSAQPLADAISETEAESKESKQDDNSS